jgi:hypothetical protein
MDLNIIYYFCFIRNSASFYFFFVDLKSKMAPPQDLQKCYMDDPQQFIWWQTKQAFCKSNPKNNPTKFASNTWLFLEIHYFKIFSPVILSNSKDNMDNRLKKNKYILREMLDDDIKFTLMRRQDVMLPFLRTVSYFHM